MSITTIMTARRRVPTADSATARGMGLLGYYLGRCMWANELCFTLSEDVNLDAIEPFFLGLQSNRSVQALQITH